MQGRSPTAHENGLLERRAADTAWDDTAKGEPMGNFQDMTLIHALRL